MKHRCLACPEEVRDLYRRAEIVACLWRDMRTSPSHDRMKHLASSVETLAATVERMRPKIEAHAAQVEIERLDDQRIKARNTENV
jgi:outer membrane murein-binding lipoprotein Lpp